jgi:predicted amino acid racemase
MVRQGILALGRQDVEPEGLVPPAGVSVLGTSSDHLVVDLGDHGAVVGDELTFGIGYGGLLRASTSPFVAVVEHMAPASALPQVS